MNERRELQAEELAQEVQRLRSEMLRAAEVIGAQLFDLKSLSKSRRTIMTQLASDLLTVADGHVVHRNDYSNYHRTRTSQRVRDRFPELAGPAS